MANEHTRLLSLAEVVRRTSISRTEIYRRMAAGTFPERVPVGSRRRAWIEAEIECWIRECVAERDAAA